MSDTSQSNTLNSSNASPVFRLGQEILVNEHTSSLQNRPQVVALADGRMLFTFTTWDPTDGDDFIEGVSGRLGTVNQDGSLSFGDEFRINQGTYSHQWQQQATQLSDGRLLFTYVSHAPEVGDDSVGGIVARIGTLEPDGTVSLDSEILVNEHIINFQDRPQITELDDGRILFVFDTTSLANDEEWSGVAARIGIIGSDGTIQFGNEFRVNENVEWDQGDAQILPLADGRIVATYFSGDGWVDSRNGPSLGVFARIGSVDDSVSISFGDEFQVNQATTDDQVDPQILQLVDGRILFLFVSNDPFIGTRVVARIGTPMSDGSLTLGDEIDVNEYPGGGQGLPQVIQLSDNRVLFTYEITDYDHGYALDVATRVGTLEADGSISFSEEFRVNRYTSSRQYEPQVTELPDGRVLFAFTTRADEMTFERNESNISVRILDFRGIGTDESETLVAVEDGAVLSGFGGDDELIGSAADDWFDGGSGSDLINGNGGIDTVNYNVLRQDFNRTQDPIYLDEWKVTEPDGSVDTLLDVERFELLDGNLLFDMDSPNLGFTYRIYSAGFGRTPDEGGLRFWTEVMDRFDIVQPDVDKQLFLAKQFLTADEYVDLYGDNPSNEQYVGDLYVNVLGRLPDQDGYDFWVWVMEQGYSREEILVYFAESVENTEKTAPDLDDGVWVT